MTTRTTEYGTEDEEISDAETLYSTEEDEIEEEEESEDSDDRDFIDDTEQDEQDTYEPCRCWKDSTYDKVDWTSFD